MTVLTVVAMPSEDDGDLGGRYDYSRLPEEIRIQAMTAEGVVVQGLRSAVERVVEAGKALMWAKRVFPHGEYLPWVQACGLKPPYAARLVKAAEWVSNVAGMPHLEGCGIETLFVLSADTTTDEVREWFMERCAAGKVPSRKEVQERKRCTSQATKHRSVVQEALSALKLSSEARELAARAQHISTRQLMDELQLEDLPKGKEHLTKNATYCKNGTGWWKFPIEQAVEVAAVVEESDQLVTVSYAAKTMGYSKPQGLRCLLVPSRIKQRGLPRKNGWVAMPSSERGMCYIKKEI